MSTPSFLPLLEDSYTAEDRAAWLYEQTDRLETLESMGGRWDGVEQIAQQFAEFIQTHKHSPEKLAKVADYFVGHHQEYLFINLLSRQLEDVIKKDGIEERRALLQQIMAGGVSGQTRAFFIGVFTSNILVYEDTRENVIAILNCLSGTEEDIIHKATERAQNKTKGNQQGQVDRKFIPDFQRVKHEELSTNWQAMKESEHLGMLAGFLSPQELSRFSLFLRHLFLEVGEQGRREVKGFMKGFSEVEQQTVVLRGIIKAFAFASTESQVQFVGEVMDSGHYFEGAWKNIQTELKQAVAKNPQTSSADEWRAMDALIEKTLLQKAIPEMGKREDSQPSVKVRL